jgi:hypothetical protein
MAKKLRTEEEIDRDKLALEPPRMTVLSDQPLRSADAHLDALTLAVKLGPVYDILRHPDTQTPLAIAVYGDWGTGKTSAMRWLEGLLIEWNTRGDRGKGGARGKVVRPVWFYPWKYHDKDDVWRGLIAEVILASIEARGATLGRIKKAVKEFGMFLGRSFLHALSSIPLTTAVDASSLQDIYEDYRRTVHPETNYLNEFESTLMAWVEETITDADERMVIFIDDLDRCLPEVALQVLEALKLYLNISDLIFVVGVDRIVIDQLIQKLYSDIGLEPDKSRHYLAKMFQVEVVIGPSEHQAEGFLDKQLTAIGEHTNQYWATKLGDGERRMFRGVVLRLAQRNPREIKRLLNSVLIHGAGVLHVKSEPFSFAQGMQIFLVRKILDERYTMGLTVDTRAGMEFFHRWSRLVGGGAQATVQNPEDLAAELMATGGASGEVAGVIAGKPRRSATPYAELLTEPRFAHLRLLLADRDLGQLMQIEYPADTTVLAEASPQELPRGLIREAIARQRGKAPPALTMLDHEQITQLVLEGEEIVDIAPVQLLHNLESLDLSFTAVEDLRPLKSLDRLHTLVLANSQVEDLTPLRELKALHTLSLANTRATDLRALRELGELRELDLRGVPIRDISELSSLTALTSLSLAQTAVEDLAPLAALTAIESLSLASTRVSDLSPLARLHALRSLYLSYTGVTDLSPLASLPSLRSLSLSGTPVSDPAPLSQLGQLAIVDLRGCPVSADAVASLRRALPRAEIRT